ncbi:hypothetical protein [Frankia sp. QA3]|nr:hypothetical protein [Frankia sp. QA3]
MIAAAPNLAAGGAHGLGGTPENAVADLYEAVSLVSTSSVFRRS